jgi:hypothetical protein
MKLKIKILLGALWSLTFFQLFSSDNQAELLFDSTDNFYSGRENVLRLKLSDPTLKNISWNIRYCGRTIASGETNPTNASEIQIKFSTPKLNPGIIANASFTCIDESGKKLLEKQLYFFPPNPFTDRTEFLKVQKIAVWEPDENGNLSKLLNSLKVPFSQLSAFSELEDNKTVLISGLDYDEFSGIQDEILQFAAKGNKTIIITPPLAGTIPIASAKYDRILFAKNSEIKKFNRKFDSKIWADIHIPQKSFKVAPFDDIISISPEKGSNGYSFCKLSLSSSKIIICAWDIAGLSEKSPTPLYLLSNLILNKKGDKQ